MTHAIQTHCLSQLYTYIGILCLSKRTHVFLFSYNHCTHCFIIELWKWHSSVNCHWGHHDFKNSSVVDMLNRKKKSWEVQNSGCLIILRAKLPADPGWIWRRNNGIFFRSLLRFGDYYYNYYYSITSCSFTVLLILKSLYPWRKLLNIKITIRYNLKKKKNQ